MTERVNGFFVSLDVDMREDDVDSVRRALLMVKHVNAVEANVVNVNDYVAEQRIKNKYLERLYVLIKELREM